MSILSTTLKPTNNYKTKWSFHSKLPIGTQRNWYWQSSLSENDVCELDL